MGNTFDSSNLGSTIASIQEKLPAWIPFSHPPVYRYVSHNSPKQLVDFGKASLWLSVAMIFFNPIFWNFVARNEYRNKSLTKIFGSPYLGCYALAVAIFSLGLIRDALYERALRQQPHFEALAHPAIQAVGWGLVALGQTLVVTSIYALGITGTYLGDYFGILMSSRVTGFPFNFFSDPMYVGSTFAFLGGALLYRSPVGIALSALVWVVYTSAIQLEGPFTDMIYSAAHKKSETTLNKKSSSSSLGKKSTPTASTQTTPRKSSRKQVKSEDEAPSTASTTATAGESSYASVAAHEPSAEGAGNVTPPRKEPRINSIRRSARKSRGGASGTSGSEDEVATASSSASPARVTRSRSKGRTSGPGEE